MQYILYTNFQWLMSCGAAKQALSLWGIFCSSIHSSAVQKPCSCLWKALALLAGSAVWTCFIILVTVAAARLINLFLSTWYNTKESVVVPTFCALARARS